MINDDDFYSSTANYTTAINQTYQKALQSIYNNINLQKLNGRSTIELAGSKFHYVGVYRFSTVRVSAYASNALSISCFEISSVLANNVYVTYSISKNCNLTYTDSSTDTVSTALIFRYYW